MTTQRCDDAVIGANFLGLSLAYHLAKRGRSVVVLERRAADRLPARFGFGGSRPIHAPAGEARELALRSRELLLELGREVDASIAPVGSLHLAYQEDEVRLLNEHLASNGLPDLKMLSHDEVCASAAWTNPHDLHAGLFSPHETAFDPAELIDKLIVRLETEHGVQFQFRTSVRAIEQGYVRSDTQSWEAGHIWITTGRDFATLFPLQYDAAGFVRFRRQMAVTRPQPTDTRLGPLLFSAAALAYPGEALGAMQTSDGAIRLRLARDSQCDDDSPYYDGIAEDDALDRLARLANWPERRIARRWTTVETRHPDRPWFIESPERGVTLISGLGDEEFTYGLGLAEKLVTDTHYPKRHVAMVVFDIAGTALLDGNGGVQCLRDALRDTGVDVMPAAIQQVMHWPKPAAIRHLLESSDNGSHANGNVSVVHANFAARLKRYYALDPRVAEVPGAAEVFRTLRRAGIKVALNAGFGREITQAVLHRLGWKMGDAFDAVISTDDVSRGRPALDAIHELMKRCDVTESAHVVKVGSDPHDLQEGKDAHCGLLVGVAGDNRAAEHLAPYHPHFVLKSVKELPDLLKKLDVLKAEAA